ncbi:5'-tyrosyl-DNA phosphodiesterase [Ditylenchus destructor]|nr:5'-tyrosyl-DNA phosphodiesterase [Ditylenchus destructor]
MLSKVSFRQSLNFCRSSLQFVNGYANISQGENSVAATPEKSKVLPKGFKGPSAFVLYYQDFLKNDKLTADIRVTERMKVAAKNWKELDEQVKQDFVKRSLQLKEQKKDEFNNLSPAEQDKLFEEDTKKREPKGFNGPTAFNLYYQDFLKNDKLTAELRITERMKVAAKNWKELDEQVKQDFVKQSQQLKEQKKEEFNNLSPAEQNKLREEAAKKHDEKKSAQERKDHRKEFNTDKPASRSLVEAQSRMREAAQAWKDLPEDEKQKYKDMASEDSKEFHEKLEAWKTKDSIQQSHEQKKDEFNKVSPHEQNKLREEDSKEREEKKAQQEGKDELTQTKFFSGEQMDVDEGGPSTRAKSPQPPKKKPHKEESEFPPEITIVSWNVDGIHRADPYAINPEVIFLQEVTNGIVTQLRERMEKKYHIFISNPNFSYYCVTLVSKNIEIQSNEIIEFANTDMGRSAILVHAQWRGLKLKFINAHLESLKQNSNSKKRTAQFAQCMKLLGELAAEDEPNTLAVFGGDLNIRDKEVTGMPVNVKDAWIAAGSNPETQFTWDMSKNDNMEMFGARCRFDRVYFSGPYTKLDFSFHGTERIPGVNCFPSDHFGICCRFYSPGLRIIYL